MTTDSTTLHALRLAGRQIVREVYETTGEVPVYLARKISRQEDFDRLDEVARERGLDGMPPGDGTPMPEYAEWVVVFEGVREELAKVRAEEELKRKWGDDRSED